MKIVRDHEVRSAAVDGGGCPCTSQFLVLDRGELEDLSPATMTSKGPWEPGELPISPICCMKLRRQDQS